MKQFERQFRIGLLFLAIPIIMVILVVSAYLIANNTSRESALNAWAEWIVSVFFIGGGIPCAISAGYGVYSMWIARKGKTRYSTTLLIFGIVETLSFVIWSSIFPLIMVALSN